MVIDSCNEMATKIIELDARMNQSEVFVDLRVLFQILENRFLFGIELPARISEFPPQ